MPFVCLYYAPVGQGNSFYVTWWADTPCAGVWREDSAKARLGASFICLSSWLPPSSASRSTARAHEPLRNIAAWCSECCGSCHIDLPVTCMSFWNAPKLTFPSKLAFSQSQSAMLTKFEGSFQTSLHEDMKLILPFSSSFLSSPPSHYSVMLPKTLVLDPSSFPAPRVRSPTIHFCSISHAQCANTSMGLWSVNGGGAEN